MKGKKSFILYCDLLKTVEKLPDSDAGKLFKIILNYVNDNDPVIDNLLLDVTFEPIKQQLKRDLNKWDDIKIKRSEAGKASAVKRKQQKATKSTSVKSVEQTSTKSTVTVNVNDNVNDINIYRSFAHLKITESEVEKLKVNYTDDQINDVLDSIQNYAKNKNYKSLYLTASKWLKKQFPKNESSEMTNEKWSKMSEEERFNHFQNLKRNA